MSTEPPVPDSLSPARRREALLHGMSELHSRGIHCGSCGGICCTHLANSMKITRGEAEEMKAFLVSEGRWNADLLSRLSDTVRRYRLDHDLGDGRRSLRRTYTCPFFSGGTHGCTIAPTHKPFGCLAFNPRSPGLTRGGDCVSDTETLEKVTQEGEETEPIPIALLKLRHDHPK